MGSACAGRTMNYVNNVMTASVSRRHLGDGDAVLAIADLVLMPTPAPLVLLCSQPTTPRACTTPCCVCAALATSPHATQCHIQATILARDKVSRTHAGHDPTQLFNLRPGRGSACQTGWQLSLTLHALRTLPDGATNPRSVPAQPSTATRVRDIVSLNIMCAL